MSRVFNGANDSVHCSKPATGDATGAFTWLAIVRSNSNANNWKSIMGAHTSGGTAVNQFAWKTSTPIFEYNIGGANLANGPSFTIATGWVMCVLRKATGSATPIFSVYNFTSATWAHTNGSAAVGNAASWTGGTLRYGEWEGGDDMNGWLAVTAGFNYALSQAQAVELSTNLRTSDIANASGGVPVWLHEWDSPAATPIVDLMGNGVDQVAVNGTAQAANDPAGWVYDGLGGPPATPVVNASYRLFPKFNMRTGGRI